MVKSYFRTEKELSVLTELRVACNYTVPCSLWQETSSGNRCCLATTLPSRLAELVYPRLVCNTARISVGQQAPTGADFHGCGGGRPVGSVAAAGRSPAGFNEVPTNYTDDDDDDGGGRCEGALRGGEAAPLAYVSRIRARGTAL